MSISSLNQKGFSQLLILVLLVVGLAVGLWALNNARTVINPKAYEAMPPQAPIPNSDVTPLRMSYGENCTITNASSPTGNCAEGLSCINGTCRYNDRSRTPIDQCGLEVECVASSTQPNFGNLQCVSLESSDVLDRGMVYANPSPSPSPELVEPDFKRIGLASNGEGRCAFVGSKPAGYNCLYNFECKEGLVCMYVQTGANTGRSTCSQPISN